MCKISKIERVNIFVIARTFDEGKIPSLSLYHIFNYLSIYTKYLFQIHIYLYYIFIAVSACVENYIFILCNMTNKDKKDSFSIREPLDNMCYTTYNRK